MNPAIAIVGMACCYPDARSPSELWENVLAQRRAFRRIPPERLRLEDYYSADTGAPDSTYLTEAAVIAGYEFDRLRFHVAGSTFRSADLAHWLALDVAAQALDDAGFSEGAGLPRETTGVIMGNTLTGEFSRANALRLRWPYVRRIVEAALIAQEWPQPQRRAFLERLETEYKAPFPPAGEETLAGGLSNTIGGRICNHFDLKGGGYTVDAACAASLLAVTTACSALSAGDLDVALAGGVDLSLDPFELIGFARVGALAPDEMRVYDARSAGFWPGEGCGVVVLMRYEDALAQGRRVYAVVRGWGVSSDGRGGITRPEVEGQLLAVQRAYSRAGFGVDSVAYFEGHGTGTAVGDATELRMLARVRQAAAADAPPALIGSIKANIGHTKAAAGIAGLIKAALALHTQILPPATGCQEPHPELSAAAPALRISRTGQPWPLERPLRAGVSAMGFGGINTHVVLEGAASERRDRLDSWEHSLLSSAQDAEVLFLVARDIDGLRQRVERLAAFAARLSRAEITDLAAQLERTLDGGLVRAAIVAATPAQLAAALETLKGWLAEGVTRRIDIRAGVFLGAAVAPPRIGFLFPGQGAPIYLEGGALARRFAFVRDLYQRANLPAADGVSTAVAQPAVVTASLAGLRALEQIGIQAQVAIGHSLGELTALSWARALSEAALLRIAAARGKAMADLGDPAGAMATIGAGPQAVEALRNGDPVVIAGLNSPTQTVISGEASAVHTIVARAQRRGMPANRLLVSHAFHSPLVAPAASVLAEQLAREQFKPLRQPVVSTVTGAVLEPGTDLRAHLCDQVTQPVRFTQAVMAAVERLDLLIEVGPGQVLSRLVAEFVNVPAVAIDAGGSTLVGYLKAVGAAFSLGAPVHHQRLFAGRFTRPFDLDWRPRFFANPCELAPLSEEYTPTTERRHVEQNTSPATQPDRVSVAGTVSEASESSPLELVRRLVAERIELPLAAVRDDSRLLSDLHLSSITVGQLVAEAARRLRLASPSAPTDYADATIADVAAAMEHLAQTGATLPPEDEARTPPGIDAWIRSFTIELIERPLPRRAAQPGTGDWRVLAPDDHPFAQSLRAALMRAGGGGVVVCLPPEPDERHIPLLLEAARPAEPAGRFVLVQHDRGAAAFARTLYLETDVPTCVVGVPPDHPQAVEWVVAEALAAVGYSEAHYDSAGRRREPFLQLLADQGEPLDLPLGTADVLLVTGGGKGITAECAFSLAQAGGCGLALLGRSLPEADAELKANLDRLVCANISFRYCVADVTDAAAVRSAVRMVEAELGPVTGILHGAARNVPRLLRSLDEATVLSTLAPKINGLQHVLAAVEPERLRLLLSFGSIIARMGLPGEADYALANEWLAWYTGRFQAEHPACRCLVLEWSIWSEVGMGARLGGTEALARAGITPIPPDTGVAILRQLLARQLPAVAIVVTGRFGEPPTLRVAQPDLPFLRFLERRRVYYPGLELIVDAELSADSDPYLNDHIFQGERLLPAVMGLEAIAQAAMALVGTDTLPIFEDVTFSRPIVIAERTPTTIRLVALAREPGCVDVALRSSDTAFQVDCFRATCRFGNAVGASQPILDLLAAPDSLPPVQIDPERELYGGLFFHRGRFQRVRGYRQLAATACAAEIGAGDGAAWFSQYLPAGFVLGDPGARDAFIHAIQVCVPHAALLPIGIERLAFGEALAPGPRVMRARERSRTGDLFTYDLVVHDPDGRVQETWTGLRLRMVGGAIHRGPWVPALLGPYVERRLQELIPGSSVTVAVEQEHGDRAIQRTVGTVAVEQERATRSDQAIQRALGEVVPIRRRPDGKPEADDLRAVSAAHTLDLTLAVAGPAPLGCDIEQVETRPLLVWDELLGRERLVLAEVIARSMREEVSAAATRVWSACECLKKAGVPGSAPLVLAETSADGWAVLSSGPVRIATWIAPVHGTERQVALAVLLRCDNARV